MPTAPLNAVKLMVLGLCLMKYAVVAQLAYSRSVISKHIAQNRCVVLAEQRRNQVRIR